MQKVYTVPLKNYFLKKPREKRAKGAINGLKKFLIKNTRREEILISKKLNEKIWENGIRNPPRKIKINVEFGEEKVYAKLFDETETFLESTSESKESKNKDKKDIESKKEDSTSKKDEDKEDKKEKKSKKSSKKKSKSDDKKKS
ncbi:MAG: 50S ribosomal protein L31e, partial [Candidatus Woesearchaeota archaeon]